MLNVFEGRGYLVRTAEDSPLVGAFSTAGFAEDLKKHSRRVLGDLASILKAFPAGLDLICDLRSGGEKEKAAFEKNFFLLASLPGLRIHLKEDVFSSQMRLESKGDFDIWLHGTVPPSGEAGLSWRQGHLGWVREDGDQWSLPGFGRILEIPSEGVSQSLWGEVILPLGALGEIDYEELAACLGSVQAGLERDFSLRMSAKAWPEAFPFQRRRAGWRLALLGGREFAASSGSWEKAVQQCRDLQNILKEQLKCSVWVGTCHDFSMASKLGHQAMRDGLPWRSSLPLPPASPIFSVGLGADPREPVALEARSVFPAPFADLLSHPPLALLRVPKEPEESAVEAFLRGQVCLPAIRWLTPEVPLPGPFQSERPWAALGAYPPLTDIRQANQPGLFDEDIQTYAR